MEDDHKAAFERISEFADLSMWRHGSPGLVLGVTDREKTIFSSAKGLSDVIARRPVSIDTLFEIGSVSKSFTSIALMQLAEKGIIDIHGYLKEYLPWFSIRSTHSDITLHHLMTHTAGICTGSEATPTSWTEIWDLRDTEATCEPGTYYHYSNAGYKALGLVLESVTGRTCDRIVREEVLEGSGMRSSEAAITNSIRGRIAVAHQPLHDDRPSNHHSELYPATWYESNTADGSICAPVEDMLSYIRMLLNGGEGPWGRVMSAESFKQMTTPYITPQDEIHLGDYGYGLNIETVGGHKYIGHQGGMVGHYTSMLMDMDSGFGVMVMVNGPGNPDEVARFAIEAVRNSAEGGRLPQVPSREDAFKTSAAQGYVGTYTGPDGVLEVVDRNGTLHLKTGGLEFVLEPRERNSFFVDGRGFELFLLEFERVGTKFQRVHHGARTYAREGSNDAKTEPRGEGEVRYDGHYRSQNPWLSNFRVVKRMSGLVFVLPHGESEPMAQIGRDAFRIGRDERSPERITFDCIIDGVATSATVSGTRFGRTFTP